MFVQASWFEARQRSPGSRWRVVSQLRRIGLYPANWRGHLYLAMWSVVAGVPAVYFLSHRYVPEMLIWTMAALGGFTFDAWCILSKTMLWRRTARAVTSSGPALEPATSEIVFLDEQSSPRTANGRYDFYLKG